MKRMSRLYAIIISCVLLFGFSVAAESGEGTFLSDSTSISSSAVK